jgi:predicted phosphodiesterase
VRIGLASDTFGNLEPLEKALDVFSRAAVERVYFLGGHLADLDAALARRRAAGREAPVPRTDAEFLAAVEGALARQAAADPLDGRILRVASRGCAEYSTGAAPRRQVDLVEGRICCLVHDKAELTRDDIANATVLFHGNCPRAGLVQIGARCFVTPGRLRAPAPGEGPATFAILDVGASELSLIVFSGEGAELAQERASLAAGAKLSVRG